MTKYLFGKHKKVMTDVLLVAGDLEEPAHSLILSLHSAYFKTLFQVFCRT